MAQPGRKSDLNAKRRQTTREGQGRKVDPGTPEVQARILPAAIQLVAKHPLWRHEMAHAAREVESVLRMVYGKGMARAARMEPSYGGTEDVPEDIDRLHAHIYMPWARDVIKAFGQDQFIKMTELIIAEKAPDYLSVLEVILCLDMWCARKAGAGMSQLADLRQVLRLLKKRMTAIEAHNWINQSQTELENKTPAQAAAEGRGTDVLVIVDSMILAKTKE